MKKLLVSYWGGREISIDNIYGYSLSDVLGVKESIEIFLEEEYTLPENVIYMVFSIFNINYVETENDPTDPSWWDFDHNLLRSVYR